MFNIDHVQSFLSLAETLNISKTARLLYTSQSTVSRRIDSLEKALDTKLFIRTTRKIELTDAGAAVLEDFLEIQEHYRKIREVTAELSNSTIPLKLTCPEFWLGDYVEPLMAFIAEQEPTLSIIIESNPPIQGLNLVGNGNCDVAFGVGLPTNLDPFMSTRFFINEQLIATIYEDHRFTNRETITLELLADLPLVLLNDDTAGFNRMNEELLQLFSRQNLEPSEIRYASQVETLGVAIAACKGYGLTPRSLRHMHRDYLTTLPFDENGPTLPLCFFFRTEHLNNELMIFLDAAERFAKTLKV